MPLPAPNLDDRRFQDLVDDAKRLVQQRCPEWTDHNVHDPGVTLIETFAWMTDQLLFRLNQVPDRNYVKFLDLIGVTLHPPAAAKVDVTFWLSAPQQNVVSIPRGTRVATPRSETADAVVFHTVDEFPIVPCALDAVRTASSEDAPSVDMTRTLQAGDEFLCFDAEPQPGNLFYVGLSDAVPSCAVALRLSARIEGVGVRPDDPPLIWEAWTASGWEACDLDRDDTGGINKAGDIVVHVPAGHVRSVVDGRTAGWLRGRVLPAREGQEPYNDSPRISGLEAFTIGGTAAAEHSEAIDTESLGVSEFVPGQRFQLGRSPVLRGDGDLVVEVREGGRWERWFERDDFAGSTPADRHFVVDHSHGEIQFGPAVRERDGTETQYGAVPPKGAGVRVRNYRTGGGDDGNVAAGSITVLHRPIPLVSRVENRRNAVGGRNGETVDNAKRRGPLELRVRNRAVTLEDYEYLAASAALDAARVRAIPTGPDDSAVRIMVVPHAPDDRGEVPFGALRPTEDLMGRIARRLEEVRTIGARVAVEAADYVPVTVVARVKASPYADAGRVQREAVEALFRYFNPLSGGPGGEGWPFGRPVQVGEVYAVLQRLDDVELVEEARVFPANPRTGERGAPVDRIELGSNALVFSFDHQVLVAR